MYEPPNLGTHISVNKSLKQEYSGPHDEESGISHGIGYAIYNRDDYRQSYEGEFLWTNMHGYGEYQWQPLNCKHEGQFYANKKEGYGRFSLPSGAYFEGLYRNDQRFGPGVYTDAAGYQDVGIWVASKLIRLSRIFESDHVMPRLATTDEDKIRILRYRQIIHLQKDEIKHVAENMLESLTHLRNYDKNVLSRAEELYNRKCRDSRALSFNRPRYDKTFFGHESDQLTIDVLKTEDEIQQKIAEKPETIAIEGSSSVVIPQIKESNIIHEAYYPVDVLADTHDIHEISQQATDVEVLKNKEEDEHDYCGIKEMDLASMNNIHLPGDHEKQWNIFQSSAVAISQDSPENSAINSLSEENLRNLGGTQVKVTSEEFDDFGRKIIKDVLPTKKVIVTDLMAWNNTPILIELLIHVFKHRNFEKKLSFDISKVLAGRRGWFRQEGSHEKAALKLLEACSSGWQNIISKLISTHNLDVDIADSRGNTGLLLAAARDRVEVIDTLVNLGANIDSINDECLTPLSLCVLRLLELVHGVTDWSKAFLPKTIMAESIADDKTTELKNVEQWHGRVSYESLVQQVPKRMDWNPLPSEIDSLFNSKDFSMENELAIDKNAIDTEPRSGPSKVIKAEQRVFQKLEQHPNMQTGIRTQKYIFDMSPITGADSGRKFNNPRAKNSNNKTKTKTTTDKKPEGKNISSKSEEFSKYSKQMKNNINTEVSAKKEQICATVSKLLCRGADPNFAQVPYPVLIMAIFAKMPSLISELLHHGADPDTTLSKIDYSLTPLLILAVLPPTYEHALMAKTLLKAKADPSIRADPEYRPDLLKRLQQNRLPEFIDNSEGITALHLLAVRPDMDADVDEYLRELITVICQYSCIKRSDLYQGHSPLSLAIFEGNLTAAKAFVGTAYINVNEELDADLGNAMLMLVSCLLQELLPPDLLQEFLELLLEHGGCPFASAKVLNEEYNQIEYGRKELMKMSSPPENKVEVNEMKNKSKSKGFKRSKPPDTRNFAKSMDFVEKIAKEKLIKTIQAKFVRDLMDSPIMRLSTENQSDLPKDPILKYALTWMTGEDVANVAKTMNYSRASVRNLVRLFVTACIMLHQETLTEIHTLIANETEKIISKVMPLVVPTKPIETVADKRSGKGEKKNFERFVACQPKSDLEDNRFKVCFGCLAVHGKVLISCPKCKRVYFCSEECNLKCNRQEANLHQCPVFYQEEWIRLQKIAMTVGLDPISYMLERFNNPELYIDLEKKTRLHIESRGKQSLKNQDDNTYASTPKPKCKDQDSIAYRKDDKDQQNGYQLGDKDTEADATKEQKRHQKIKTEYTDRDIKSKKQQIKHHAFDGEDKKAGTGDINSKTEKTDHLLDNKKVRERDNRSKNSDKKGRRFDANNDERDAFNNIKSEKGFKESHENRKNNDEKAANNNMKWKEAKKNRYGRVTGESEKSDGIKIKLQKNKREDQIKENGTNILKLRTGKKKDKEDDRNSKLKGKDKHWKGKKREGRSKNVKKSEDNRSSKHEATRNKQDWKNGINNQTREEELNASDEKYKINRSHVGTNIPEKCLDWLLKVSKSAGKRLDIDMLLQPYVVFAQGDTYFRILPANQDPKFAGNYSLI